MNEIKPPKHIFLKKFLRHLLIGFSLALVSLFIGMLGYHHFEKLSWVDSYLNAAMILSGMGPATELHTTAGKIFAGSYALFSGIVFLIVIAIMSAPVIYHFLQHYHIMDVPKAK